MTPACPGPLEKLQCLSQAPMVIFHLWLWTTVLGLLSIAISTLLTQLPLSFLAASWHFAFQSTGTWGCPTEQEISKASVCHKEITVSKREDARGSNPCLLPKPAHRKLSSGPSLSSPGSAVTSRQYCHLPCRYLSHEPQTLIQWSMYNSIS